MPPRSSELGNELGKKPLGGLILGGGQASLEVSSSAAVQLDAVRIAKPPVLSLAPIAPLAGGLARLAPFTDISWPKTGSPLGAGGGSSGAAQMLPSLASLIHPSASCRQASSQKPLEAPIRPALSCLATLICFCCPKSLKEPYSAVTNIAARRCLACHANGLPQTTEISYCKDCLYSYYQGDVNLWGCGELCALLASPCFSLLLAGKCVTPIY